MKILFVYRAYESIGIEILSAVLKKNNFKTDLEYFPSLFKDALVDNDKFHKIFSHKKNRIQNIIRKKPDIVAFSSLTDTFSSDFEIASEIKRSNPEIKILFGGIHATVLPEKLLSNDVIDYICIGEGEEAIVELCEALKKGNIYPNIKNICFKKDGKIIKNQLRPLIKDINDLPFPDKDLFFEKAPYFKEYYTIMTSRGCPYNCYFCNNNVYRKIYNTNSLLRRRSPENVIKELQISLKKYNYKFVIFEDDAFVSQKEWSLNFLELYSKKIKKPFQCLINPKNIDDDIAKALNKAGCKNVEIGIQSMEENLRKDFLNRTENLIEIEKCISSFIKYKVPFNIDHIGGIPGESKTKIIESFKKYLSWNPNRITYFYLTYYPGTKVSELAKEKGILTKKEIEDLNSGKSSSFEHGGNVSPKDILFHDKIRTIGDWGVFYPTFFQKVLKNSSLFKIMPTQHFIGRIIPAVINIFCGNEVRGMYIVKKYIYHFLRGGF